MKRALFAFSAVTALAVGLNACKEKHETQQYFNTANMDSTVKPGDNFYLYVNGGWLKKAVIPATQSSAGGFYDLYNKSRKQLKDILDEITKNPQKDGSLEQKVADFYLSGMDSATVDKLGYEPVKPMLQQIDAITDAKGVMAFEAQAQQNQLATFFIPYISADEKNSTKNIPTFFQAGLGLPDRDYYFKSDAETQKVQTAYKKFLQRLFVLTGTDAATATANVNAVYELEKQLAAGHLTNVELRDPQKNYNKFAVADLDKQYPAIGWSAYVNNLSLKVDSVNIGQPAYAAALNKALTTTPLATWKLYLKAFLLNNTSSFLSSDFVNNNFEYHNKALSGQQQIKPRWERITSLTDGCLSEALGRLYVQKYFSEDAKKRMLDLVNNLQKAFAARIQKLDWMSDSTKQKALAKMNTFLKKIGYPDKWKDYSSVTINRNTFFANVMAASQFEYKLQAAKAGKPVDKTEWQMTPATVNAYYNPTFNEIVFPAAILQFPFFDPNADDAINYGGIGMVIGHEMTHGFDDQGAQYDKDGNMSNWWGKGDEEKFKAKSKQVIDLYNGFTVLDSLHINGALTTGENMADIGGVAIAYDAFKMTKQGQGNEKIDGFTPDQRFFLSVAQIWQTKQKDESLRNQVLTNPHSPAMFRVLGPLMNFTPFYEAFNVKQGDKMWRPEAERIKIW